jgi:hypothetical protein
MVFSIDLVIEGWATLCAEIFPINLFKYDGEEAKRKAASLPHFPYARRG